MADTTVLDKFCKATGFKAEDILNYNAKNLIFVTKFGGKYEVKNNKVRTLSGPPYPKQDSVAAAAVEAADEVAEAEKAGTE